jgi:exonuclease III
VTVLNKKVVDVPTMKYQSINLSKKVFQKSVFKCKNSEKQFHHFEERKSSSGRSTTLLLLPLLCRSTTTLKDYYAIQKDKSFKIMFFESKDCENLIVSLVCEQTFQKNQTVKKVFNKVAKPKCENETSVAKDGVGRVATVLESCSWPCTGTDKTGCNSPPITVTISKPDKLDGINGLLKTCTRVNKSRSQSKIKGCSGEIVPFTKSSSRLNNSVSLVLNTPISCLHTFQNLYCSCSSHNIHTLILYSVRFTYITYFAYSAYFVCFMDLVCFAYLACLVCFSCLACFAYLECFTCFECFACFVYSNGSTHFAYFTYILYLKTLTFLPFHQCSKLLTLQNVAKLAKMWLGTLLLRSGDIESNPGPDTGSKNNIQIRTYNARGLRCNLKLKRILNSCHKIIQSNPFAVLGFQETHLTKDDIESLKFKWRHGFVLSPGTNKQCGVLLLYGDSWTQLASETDAEGRRASVVLAKGTCTFIFNCLYAPNDHNVEFFADIYDKMAEQITNFPDAVLNVFGDFNVVLEDIDGVNRQKTNSEAKASKLIIENNKVLNLVDTFRALNPTGGFTWVRDKCGSRLDMIFSSKCDFAKIKSSSIDWTFDDSDHAMVHTELELIEISKRGPGLPRVDASILDRPDVKEKILKKLDEAMSQIPTNWDPHMILEFCKMSLRSIFAEERKKVVGIDRIEIESLKSQIQVLKMYRENLLLESTLNSGKLNEISESITSLENELEPYNLSYSRSLAFKARAKWYEEGEKSNKYFLNMIKRRSAQTSIEKIVTDEGESDSQEGIATLIKNFYSNLYNEKESIIDEDDEYLKDLPQLSEEDRRKLDCEITLEELVKTLKECKDSAPGPDGIPYSVYLHFWDRMGPVLLRSWKHSIIIGKLSDGQRLSTITLLPKEGKDKIKIENWRPITLTNCDVKIFTKLLSKRVSSVLDKIIIPTQTAYIPGRQVADNLRLLEMYRSHCERIEQEAILVSLDAKKAFDSVNHKYMYKTLTAYGFSEDFVKLVQMLYNDLKADILVNGYRTVMIKILRSVKQGCSLSCCLFILCIDPLLRKIESNKKIAAIELENRNIKVSNKTGTFADDVFAITTDDPDCLNEIFAEYNKFSRRSGIELNVDKTEILRLGSQPDQFKKVYFVNNLMIESVESVKICGITFSNNKGLAYKKNIKDKIIKLERQLIMWLSRGLTFEGKILIVKTFGISQILYSLQVCHIEPEELKTIERIIFKFIWNKKWNNKPGPDRIKRCVMKQEHKFGGLKAPDIAHMNSALKVKQLIRSSQSSHPVKLVQDFLFQNSGHNYTIRQEYCKLVDNDSFIKLAQITINEITDKMRNCLVANRDEDSADLNCWNLIASTNIRDYITRKKQRFNSLFVKHLNALGIITYFDLLNESKFPRSDRIKIFADNVLTGFPKEWKEKVESLEMVDNNRQEPNWMCFKIEKCIETSKVTVSHIRKCLLPLLKDSINIQDKHKLEDIDNCSDNPFLLARKMTIATAIRSFKFRLLHKDIFSKSRLHKIKLVENNFCDHCLPTAEVIEDLKHLLWECPGSRATWNTLQQIFLDLNIEYQISLKSIIMGIQNAPISIELIVTVVARLLARKGRPKSLNREQINREIVSLIKIEEHIARKTNKMDFHSKKWEIFESLKS